MDPSRLVEHFRDHSSLMVPVNAEVRPVIFPVPEMAAVVFDVYGTLMISGTGDISLAQSGDRSPALAAALATAGYTVVDPHKGWAKLFFDTLGDCRKERARDAEVVYPEVRIEEVWCHFIGEAAERQWITGQGDLELAIVDYECRINPCWPMPGLEETLDQLSGRGLRLGIVSNAQFYTPLLFQAFLGRTHLDCGFDERLCVWSYREREGKPSKNLYQKLKASLEAEGLRPENTLYIGNDLRNDIWPARSLGFHTALFAGDARSLRWREDDPDCRKIRPDFVITHLRQLAEMLC